MKNKSREEILEMLWKSIDDESLSSRERLDYIKEINKLEALYKDAKTQEDIEIKIVDFSGLKKCVCPHCGVEL